MQTHKLRQTHRHDEILTNAQAYLGMHTVKWTHNRQLAIPTRQTQGQKHTYTHMSAHTQAAGIPNTDTKSYA